MIQVLHRDVKILIYAEHGFFRSIEFEGLPFRCRHEPEISSQVYFEEHIEIRIAVGPPVVQLPPALPELKFRKPRTSQVLIEDSRKISSRNLIDIIFDIRRTYRLMIKSPV